MLTSRFVCGLVALCAVLAMGTVHTEAGVKGPFGSIRVGNWQGGAYVDEATGKYAFCAAGANYLSGVHFIVAIAANGEWNLGYAHQDWQLQPGEVIPINVTFDGREQFHLVGRATGAIYLFVPMPPSSALLRAFRRSAEMSAVAKGNLFRFSLSGTSQLLPTLANCHALVGKRGIAAATDFTVKPAAPTAPAAAAAPAPPVATTLKTPEPETGSPDLQIEAVQLASNFILKSTLQNPKLLGRSELPAELAASGAAWRADEASGVVRIIPPKANVKGIDIAAAVAGADAKECKGKFASGRISELVDSDVVFRGFALCEDTEGARRAEYFIIPRTRGGFVMFSVVSNMRTEQSRNVVKDEKLVDFRKAALTAVNLVQ
jgi:hypothetical protein